jgi:hypothetical protein
MINSKFAANLSIRTCLRIYSYSKFKGGAHAGSAECRGIQVRTICYFNSLQFFWDTLCFRYIKIQTYRCLSEQRNNDYRLLKGILDRQGITWETSINVGLELSNCYHRQLLCLSSSK